MHDKKELGRVRICATYEGKGPAVFLVGENNLVRAVLQSLDDKTGANIALLNEDGTQMVHAGRSNVNGIGYIQFHDKAGLYKAGYGGSGVK